MSSEIGSFESIFLEWRDFFLNSLGVELVFSSGFAIVSEYLQFIGLKLFCSSRWKWEMCFNCGGAHLAAGPLAPAPLRRRIDHAPRNDRKYPPLSPDREERCCAQPTRQRWSPIMHAINFTYYHVYSTRTIHTRPVAVVARRRSHAAPSAFDVSVVWSSAGRTHACPAMSRTK